MHLPCQRPARPTQPRAPAPAHRLVQLRCQVFRASSVSRGPARPHPSVLAPPLRGAVTPGHPQQQSAVPQPSVRYTQHKRAVKASVASASSVQATVLRGRIESFPGFDRLPSDILKQWQASAKKQIVQAGSVLQQDGQGISAVIFVSSGTLYYEKGVATRGSVRAGGAAFCSELLDWAEACASQPGTPLPTAQYALRAATDCEVILVDAQTVKSLSLQHNTELRAALSDLLAQELDREQQDAQAMRDRIRALSPYIVPHPKHGVLGTSRQANKLRDEVLKAAKDPRRLPVMLVGEAGTGTQDLAALIHYSSCRTNIPMVKLNCERLGGSTGVELFGRGAKPGILGLLQGMPPGTTVLLEDAHLLPDGLLPRVTELLRSGTWLAATSLNDPSDDPTASRIDCGLDPNDSHCKVQGLIPGSIRIILSSEQPLPEIAKLVKWNIKVPPLRAHPSDIPSLVSFYLTHEVSIPPALRMAMQTGPASAGAAKAQLSFAVPSIKRMQAYGWPGNEDELSLVVTRAARQHLASQSISVNTAGEAALARTMEVADRWVTWGDATAANPRLDLLDVVPRLRELVRNRIWPDGINSNFTAYVYPLVIALLLFGPQDRDHNPLLNFFWCWWWPAVYLIYPFAGRVWCAVCPFMITGELVQRWRVAQGAVLERWPRKDLEQWGPVFLFSLFAGILVWEEVWDLPNNGALSAWLLLLITAGAVVCSAFFERRMWCRYLCPIGGMNGLMAKGSLTEIRAREGVCAGNCSTYNCIKGGVDPGTESMETPGCPLYVHPAQLADNHNCVLCMSCVKACPNRSVQFRLRPPLADIWEGHEASWGELAVLGLLGGAMYLHSLSLDGGYGPLASQLGLDRDWVFGISSSHILISLACLAAPSIMVAVTDLAGRVWARNVMDVEEPAPLLTLGYGYLPIVWSGTLAFYLRWLLEEGGRVVQVAGAMVGWPAANTLPALVAAPPVVTLLQATCLGAGWLASLALLRRVAGTPTWVSMAPHALLATLFTAELWLLNIH